jgi:hypothetical protein
MMAANPGFILIAMILMNDPIQFEHAGNFSEFIARTH